MTHAEDFQQDKDGEFYVDEVVGQPGVFGVWGSESGRCYATYFDRTEAETHATNMNVHQGTEQ